MSKMTNKQRNTRFRYNKICLSYKEKYKEKELWRIVIYNGITTGLAISNYGRIFDLDNMAIPNIYKQKNTYYTVSLKLDTGSTRIIGIYRLVALMFIDIPEKYIKMGYTADDLVVDHIRDCEKDNHDDNTMWNLQWLTQAENANKYSNIRYSEYNKLRKPFSIEFRRELDQMILDDYDNDKIYKICKEKYGYEKSELKSNLQVRRRRLGKTLKEHHEADKKIVEKIDKLVIKGYSNDEIISELNLPTDTNTSRRLIQYRRSLLKIPATVSKYLNNEQNEKANELISKGLKTDEIVNTLIELYNFDFNDDDYAKFRSTIKTRRNMYWRSVREKENNTSSTTIESIS